MATSAHLVHDNFVYWTESITPSDTTETKQFRHVDLERDDPSVSAGGVRLFSVSWTGDDEDSEPTNMYDRFAVHTWELTVYYPVGVADRPWRPAQKTLLQDRHDIAKALRVQSSWSGYDADNTSTDIGLKWRKRAGADLEFDEDSDLWLLVTTWETLIAEVE